MRDERGRGGEADDAVRVCGNFWRGGDVCVYGAGGGAVFVWRGLGRLYKRRRGIGVWRGHFSGDRGDAGGFGRVREPLGLVCSAGACAGSARGAWRCSNEVQSGSLNLNLTF